MSVESKTVVVTGASSGFGKEVAERLLDREYTVYVGARRTELMEDLRAKGGHILEMDVTSTDSVEAGVRKMISEQGQIDVVFANAGYGSYGMIESVPIQEIQHQYDVNVFGVARVLQAVLPHMRERRQGRVIITASVVSHLSTVGLGWYASTKHALAGIGMALRQELRDFGIDVVLIEPGAVKTGFGEVAFAAMDRVDHHADYADLVRGFRRAMTDIYETCPGPESTADAMVDAALAAMPKTVYRTTRDAKMLPKLQSLLSDRAFDGILLRQLRKAEA